MAWKAMEAASWQRGRSLNLLRRRTALFREQAEKYVFGAFGATKERDVALALDEGRYLANSSAALIFRVQARESHHLDFRQMRVPMSGVIVSAFACKSSGAGEGLLRDFRRSLLHEDLPCFVEAFEEDRPCIEALLRCGFHWVATKIMAGSEIKGIYSNVFGEIPLDFAERATLRVCREGFLSMGERTRIFSLLGKSGSAWTQHYSSYNKRRSWDSFALIGYSDDPGFIIKPSEMSREWKRKHPEALAYSLRETKAAEPFRWLLDLLRERIACEGFARVRFMRLRADGELTRHADITDREAGVENGKVARFHVPIISNARVRFRAWDHRGRMIEKALPVGSLSYLDQRKPHAVVNRSALDRVHLVVDVICNSGTRKLLA